MRLGLWIPPIASRRWDDANSVAGADLKTESPPVRNIMIASSEFAEPILPARICRLDQILFPGARPRLYLLLARDRVSHGVVNFKPYENVAVVTLRKALMPPVPMHARAQAQIARNPRVERSIARVGNDINRNEVLASHRGGNKGSPGPRRQVRASRLDAIV